jgi:pimeloyl-ACP methyl ester carboxylesterase
MTEPTLSRRSFNRTSLIALLAGAGGAFLDGSTSAKQRAATGAPTRRDVIKQDIGVVAWTERGMIEDVSPGLAAVTVPVTVVVGHRDQAEHEAALREIFARFLPQATFPVLEGIGHLSPLEASEALANACAVLLAGL